MHRAPEGDRVPLGPAVQNVAVYVVDENLVPVPLGAPGLICFSGVCVGRGYVNDPERTRAVYLTDPHRPGTRLYKGGDYGRWTPEGKLEFLGRRDSQVKISGFRIEIGEIDNALLRVPGVDDAAVVVAERPDRGKYLVAFYAGVRDVEADVLRERLGRSLPHYMVPVAFHRRDKLPLTANGKIDTKALTALAAELEIVDEPGDPPRTATERRLAAAYATVLGVADDQIGRLDHFFDRGGSSLSAVKLAIALKKTVSLKDVTRHPVLADLAALIDGRSGPAGAVGESRAGLLQLLSEPDGAPAGTLICFPYAGGNAVNFEPMARALRGRGLAVYAVELPGHDLASRMLREREPFAPIGQVVEQVVAEIARRGLTDVLLWGHSSGTAPAVATARALEARGVPVRRVFLGAQLLGDADRRRAAVAELSGLTDADIAARLAADGGYTALGELDAQRAAHVGAAYRHDCVSAHRCFLDALDDPTRRETRGAGHRRRRRGRPEHHRLRPAARRVAAAGRRGRPARARRRRPLLLTHPTGADRGGRPARSDRSRLRARRFLPVITEPIDRKDIPMSSSLPTSAARGAAGAPQAAAAAGRGQRRPGRLGRGAPGRAARHPARERRAPGPRARPA